jgi:hypothetical protein
VTARRPHCRRPLVPPSSLAESGPDSRGWQGVNTIAAHRIRRAQEPRTYSIPGGDDRRVNTAGLLDRPPNPTTVSRNGNRQQHTPEAIVLQPPTFRFSGGFAGPGRSSTDCLTRPYDELGLLGVQDQPHVSTAVVSSALARSGGSREPGRPALAASTSTSV